MSEYLQEQILRPFGYLSSCNCPLTSSFSLFLSLSLSLCVSSSSSSSSSSTSTNLSLCLSMSLSLCNAWFLFFWFFFFIWWERSHRRVRKQSGAQEMMGCLIWPNITCLWAFSFRFRTTWVFFFFLTYGAQGLHISLLIGDIFKLQKF